MDPTPADDFDYSTPEAQDALSDVTALILDIHASLRRKTVLYERTLGLAVVPVLLRRAALITYRRVRAWRQGIR